MIPISDDNPTLRTPIVTYLILALIAGVWLFVQGAGFDEAQLIASICGYGMIPAEVAGLAPPGTLIRLGPGVSCTVGEGPPGLATTVTSMFLHGGWAHLLGNGLFMWVFGNNVEDAMGRLRFVAFYLVCGLLAAGAHVALSPGSPIPTVGASGAISGVMGAYLVLHPRARVKMLFIFVIIIRIIPLPAWVVLIWWFALQLLSGLPELTATGTHDTGGVAFGAHIGGGLAGLLLIKLFENPRLTRAHRLATVGPRSAGRRSPWR